MSCSSQSPGRGVVLPQDGGQQPHTTAWAAALKQLDNEARERFNLADTPQQDMKAILTDVLQAANEKRDECMTKRWKVTINGRVIVLRDVMEKISAWVDKILKIGDVAIQYDPVHAALPWAAIRLIIQATVNDVNIFGYVAKSIEDVTNIISTCTILELRYLLPGSSRQDIYNDLSEAVISLYAAVLRYLSSILHYFGDRWAVRLIKSVGQSKTDLEEKFGIIEVARKQVWDLMHLAEAQKTEQILDSVAILSEGLKVQSLAESDRYVGLETVLKQLQEPINRIGTISASIQDGLQTDTRAQILKSISSISYPTHHKTAKKGRLVGSGQWLLAKEVYKTWRRESSSSVLWLHGIPGSGKTKLASLVIDNICDSENMAYFYCMRNPAEPERGRGDALLASLVRQLASAGPRGPILPAVLSRYEEAIVAMAGFDDLDWTTDESEEVLLDLLGEYPTVTLVLDALDEVNQEDRQELLDVLDRLLRQAPNILKIFISSRDNLDIALHLKESPNVYIDADDNADDISAFIDQRLDKARLLHGKLDDELRSDIRQTLVKGARGMFRWVDLQIQSLLPLKVAADIKSRLGALPATLEGSYWEIYSQILESGEHAAKLAIFTFQWLMYARMPITIDGFARISSFASPTPSEGSHSGFRSTEVLDVCANLVVSRNYSFELAHLSVREFLESVQHRGVTKFLPEDSNAIIASACLRFLTHGIEKAIAAPEHPMPTSLPRADKSPEQAGEAANQAGLNVPSELSGQEDAARVQRQRIAENFVRNDKSGGAIHYVARYWVHHVNKGKELKTSQQLLSLVQAFLIDKTNVVSENFRLWCQILLLFKEASVLDEHDTDESSRLEAAIKTPNNPIWLACLNNWVVVVEYLYSIRYATIEEPRRPYPVTYRLSRESHEDHFNERGVTPLWYAMYNDKLELTEAILRCTSDPMQRSLASGGTPLERAAEMNKMEFVTLILDADHGGLEGEGAAFVAAASMGLNDMMALLIGYNADLISSDGGNALVAAAREGHVKSLVFLLESGSTISERQGISALSYAAMHQHRPILCLLIERSIGLGGLSKALITAVSNGDEASADLLVEHGALKEGPAVVRAIQAGTPLSATRLIAAGFDIEGRYLEHGRTALHYAAYKGFADVVVALLQKGAVLDGYDRNRHTPLHLATHRGHGNCVRILLEAGADVLAEDGEGKIPLDYAEGTGRKTIESLIRERMATLLEELQLEKRARDGQQVTMLDGTDGSKIEPW